MSLIKCPECGRQVSDQAKVCPGCGIEIEGRIIKCPECGEAVLKSQVVCPYCSKPLSEMPSLTPESGAPDEGIVTESDAVAEECHVENKGKSAGKVTKTLIAASVIAVLLVGTGYFLYRHNIAKNELEAYSNAMQSKEPLLMQNYLDIYTDAPQEHIDSIMGRLAAIRKIDLEWTNAVASGSKSALLEYMQLHPSGIHIQEAKIKIDSIDWVSATGENTPEAYRAYLDAHAGGLHADEAMGRIEKLAAYQVTDEEKKTISGLFADFFTSLANNDVDGLTVNLANSMTEFLHKQNATKADAIQYMRKIHSEQDITGMGFRMNNDFKITKDEVADGEFNYTVVFSVDQNVERTDTNKNSFHTLQITAKVSADGKIIEMNMARQKAGLD